MIAQAAAACLACLSAAATASAPRTDLELYTDALYLSATGLGCFPAGAEGKALERAAERLTDRRRSAAESLRLRHGPEKVDAIEDEIQRQLDNTDYNGCSLAEAADTRRKLGRTLRSLERRLGLPGAP